MNEELKIYICTHTSFRCPVHNPVYEVLDANVLFPGDMAPNGMDALFYSELLTYKYVADHPDMMPRYVGFCGYRKYFEFMDDIPDVAQLIERHGCIATEPHIVKRNVYRQYAKCFSFADMDVTKAIVACYYPWLWPTFQKMLDGNSLYTCNMYIMRREDFCEMMWLVWEVLDRYLDIVGKDLKQRIMDHPELYLKRKGYKGQVEHQYRIGGNLGERVASAFVMHRFPDAKTYKIVFTEDARPHRELHQ